jgi:hypothetical protein
MVVSGAPDEPGVYALFEDDEVIYYGCAVHGSTIHSALSEILTRVREGHGGCLQRVTRYSWEITHRPRLREAELLREFEQANQHPPRCNRALPAQAEPAIVAGERRRSS